MKLIKIFTCVLVACLMLTSCSNVSEKEYYVKYEVSTKSIYMHSTVRVSIATEKGVETQIVPCDWEGVFGPFKGLSTMVLNVDLGDDAYYNNTTFIGRISISRGNDPFALKAEERSSNEPLTMEYRVQPVDIE